MKPWRISWPFWLRLYTIVQIICICILIWNLGESLELSDCGFILLFSKMTGIPILLFPMFLWYMKVIYKLTHGFTISISYIRAVVSTVYGPFETGKDSTLLFIIMLLMLFEVMVSLASLSHKGCSPCFFRQTN